MVIGSTGVGILNVEGSGQITTTDALIARSAGSTGAVTVTGSDSIWNNSGSVYVGGSSTAAGGAGSLTISDRGRVRVGDTLRVWGDGSVTQDAFSGLSVDSVNQVNTNRLSVGSQGTGTLIISDGGEVVTGNDAFVGVLETAVGVVRVEGNGSTWTQSGEFNLGTSGTGSLVITGGGSVSTGTTDIVNFVSVAPGGNGSVLVEGGNSAWTNAGAMTVGGTGTGQASLTLSDGATVANGGIVEVGNIGSITQDATATFLMDNATTSADSDGLTVGQDGDGTLNINGGSVSVANTLALARNSGSTGAVGLTDGTLSVTGLSIGDGTATLNLTGGRFELVGDQALGINETSVLSSSLTSSGHTFAVTGEMTLQDTLTIDGANVEVGVIDTTNLGRVDGQSGSLTVQTLAVSDGTTFDVGDDQPSFVTNPLFDFAVGTLENAGLIRGNGTLDWIDDLSNLAGGEIRAAFGDNLRLDSVTTFSNAGLVNLAGGNVQIAGTVTNTGTIQGNGLLAANGGITNQGTLNLTADTNLIGDVLNESDINVLGGQTATFCNDLPQNGTLFISTGSTVAILGEFSGSSGSTGGGTVDLLPGATFSPGNSPAAVSFGGDLDLTFSDGTLIELAGVLLGEYDRTEVVSTLSLGGDLTVELLDGYTLGLNQQYEVFTADTLAGTFDNLVDGDLVGGFGGVDLFIGYDYTVGSVTLFTIPEPTSLALLGLGGLMLSQRRGKRSRV